MFSKVLGKNPSGKDLNGVRQSDNYYEEVFHNQSPTEMMVKGASFLKILRDFINKPKTAYPPGLIPSVRTDLRSLPSEKPAVVWFGHSSYLIKYKNINILIDPVFSGSASPIAAFAKSFPGSDVYSPDDFPDIDIMILTHDHYDHLDYKTISLFSAKVKHFYVSLGLESHLKYWGIKAGKITSLDWWDNTDTIEGFNLTASPGRHFSGRSFNRNKTLWSSFILKMDEYSIFIGGDSGYDAHFKEIGSKYGPFDIVFLENGQYNSLWPYIHMMPEETVKAAKDLQAKLLLPVHWAKFALAYHDWDEPVKRILKEARLQNIAVTTPMIGEPFILNEIYPTREWWNF